MTICLTSALSSEEALIRRYCMGAHDVAIRGMVKRNRTAPHILKQRGMPATLADLSSLLEVETKEDEDQAVVDEGGLDRLLVNGLVAHVDYDDVIEIALPDSGSGSTRIKPDGRVGKTVRISELSECRREAAIRGKLVFKSLRSSHRQLVGRSVTDLMEAISKTSAGWLEGHITGKCMRYAVII